MKATCSNISFRTIQPLELPRCASVMAGSDPWITLRRDHGACLAVLQDPILEIYAAELQDSVAGFVAINMTGAFVGYIRVLCVAPEFQNRGIGSALLGFAEKRIFRDSPNVFLCVSSFNIGARRLYQRLGYETIGELRDYVVAGHSEFLLRKTIGPLVR